jgi:hypothetical protein
MATTAIDAQFLQHGFDPGVTGRRLLVVGVVKRKRLLERKQMFGAVASGERLRDRPGAGVATVVFGRTVGILPPSLDFDLSVFIRNSSC